MSAAEPDRSRSDKERLVQILLQEYGTLKSEQGSRIGFRDNLLYTTIGAVGAISSVALGGFGSGGGTGPIHHAFLLVPWVTTILGWTYLVNDEKITSIRKYIESSLAPRLQDVMGSEANLLAFGWESHHRSDARRKERKGVQLAIDLWTFVISGFGGVAAFCVRANEARPTGMLSYFDMVVVGASLLVLAIMSYQFVAYSKAATRGDPPR